MRHQVSCWKRGSGLCTGQALWEALAQGWVDEVIWEQLIDEVEAQGFVQPSCCGGEAQRPRQAPGSLPSMVEGTPAWRGCQPPLSPHDGCTQDHGGGASLSLSPGDDCTQGHGGGASFTPLPGGGLTLSTLDLGGTLVVTWSEPCSDRCKPSG